MTENIIKLIEQLGFPTAVVLVMFYFGWKSGRFLAPLVKQVINKHIELLDVLEESIPRTEEAIAELARSNNTLNKIHYDPGSAFATVSTNKVVRLVALHFMEEAEGSSLHLAEAIKIADEAIRAAQDRAAAYVVQST